MAHSISSWAAHKVPVAKSSDVCFFFLGEAANSLTISKLFFFCWMISQNSCDKRVLGLALLNFVILSQTFLEISFCRFLTQVCLFALRFTKSWHAVISMGGVWCIQRVTLRCFVGLLPLAKVPYASSHKLFNEGVQAKTQIVEAASFTITVTYDLCRSITGL